MWSGLWWLPVAFRRIVHVDDNRDVVGAALVALSAAVSTAREVGPWQASDAQVAELIVAVEVAARALAGVQLAAIAQGITRGLPFTAGAGTGAAAPGRWVRSLIPVNPGEAARRATLAAALFTSTSTSTSTGPGPGATELTPTRDAVLSGAVSTAHAQVVVAAMEQLLPPHTPHGVVDEATLVEAQALLLGCAAGDQAHAPLDPTLSSTGFDRGLELTRSGMLSGCWGAVSGLVFDGWDKADLAVQAPVVVPVDVLGYGDLEVID